MPNIRVKEDGNTLEIEQEVPAPPKYEVSLDQLHQDIISLDMRSENAKKAFDTEMAGIEEDKKRIEGYITEAEKQGAKTKEEIKVEEDKKAEKAKDK